MSKIVEAGFSRIPVTEGGDIITILLIKNLIVLDPNQGKPTFVSLPYSLLTTHALIAGLYTYIYIYHADCLRNIYNLFIQLVSTFI